MALKDWRIMYKTLVRDTDASNIYYNSKIEQWIQRSGKQLGAFDKFKEEKYPVHVQTTSGKEIYKKWFDTKTLANRAMKAYMRKH